MFTIEMHVGRLIEARIMALPDVEHVVAYAEALGRLVEAAPSGGRVVVCADHRPVVIYSPPVAAKLAELFGDLNGRVERVALLVARSNATLSQQLERMVRGAHNPSRRVFHTSAAAENFLDGMLSWNERARLSRFLGDVPAAGVGGPEQDGAP